MDLKNYKIIKFPVKGKFHEMSDKEAKNTFEWFLKIIPERLEILKNCIKSENPKPARKLDFSVDSLMPLGKWLENHVHKRRMTNEEIRIEEKSISKRLPGFEIEKWMLTEETISLCYDIGIYFSRVLQNNIKNLKWILAKGRKDSIDYNKPVLISKTNITIDPAHLIVVRAFSLARSSKNKTDLLNLYNISKGNLTRTKKEWSEYWKKLNKELFEK